MSNLISGEALYDSYDVGAHWINKLSKLGIDVVVSERSHLTFPDNVSSNGSIPIEQVPAQIPELIEFAESEFQFDLTSMDVANASPEWNSWVQSWDETTNYIMASYLGYETPGCLFNPEFGIRISKISCRDRLGDINPITIIYWIPYPDPFSEVNPRWEGEDIGWTLLIGPPSVQIGDSIIDYFHVNFNADVWLSNPLRLERSVEVDGNQPGTGYPDDSGYSTTSFFG